MSIPRDKNFKPQTVKGQPRNDTDIIIPFNYCEFFIRAEQTLLFPPFFGSVIRGGLGKTLREIACFSSQNHCQSCLQNEDCVYSYLFETPISDSSSIMKKYEKAPHPFILEAPFNGKNQYCAGEEFKINLILFGQAIPYLPFVVHAFNEMGRKGIGKNKGKFKLENLKIDQDSFLPKSGRYTGISINRELCISANSFEGKSGGPSQLILNLITPTRIVYDSALVHELEFHVLVRALLRRLSLINHFHCKGNSDKFPFKRVIEKAEKVTTRMQYLRWMDLERYSFRQKKTMKMGGLLGRTTYEGELHAFIPLLAAGEILHIGKGTSFGLGKIKIDLFPRRAEEI